MQIGDNIFNHVNTFGGGMNKDSSVLLQPDGTYRDARNFQVINSDGTNYTIKDAYGNRLIFTLPKAYDAVVANFQIAPMPIGFISFPDKLIVFHANNESSSGGYGAIGVLFLTNIGQSIASDPQSITVGANTWTFDGYVPLYVHEELKFSKMYKIEGFGFPENDNIGRVYWTDYFNEPRVLDTLNPIFTTYYADTELVTGTDYMVISGAVTHNGNDYGIGLTAGNIFTAANANYTVADGQALVIKYFPYQLLNWTPSRSLGNMSFYEYGTGVKRCGSHMYFYRLGKRSDGYFTSWSYGNYPIHVGVDNVASTIGSDLYRNFVGDGSATTIVVSDKSIKLKITNIDLNFDIIQLACVEYDQLYDVFYAASIVVEDTITGTEMTLEDFGNVNKGNLTLDDITLFPASILKCKTITTDKNYNIIANITEREELDFDNSTVSISSFEYPMPTHGDDGDGLSGSCTNEYAYTNVNPAFPAANSANPAATTIIPWSRWLVTFGNLTTDTVSYNGNNYVTNDVIVGVASAAGANAQNTITFTGTGAVRPTAALRSYTSASGGTISNANLLRTLSFDYKDPLIASTHRGYWSHETYRFGLLLYDKKGNPFYVRWLGDYQMPLIATKGGLMRTDNYLGENFWSMNPSLINIDGLEFSEDVINNISGFSIVRAPRDVRIVAQGLAYQNYEIAGATTGVYPTDCVLNNGFPIANKIYTWLSPDNLLINFPEKQPINGAPDKMEEACWVSGVQWGNDGTAGNYPVTYRSALTASQAGYFYNVYAKFFTPNTDPSSPNVLRSQTIDDFINIDEGNVVTNLFGISGTDYLNILVDCGVNNFTNTNCVTAASGINTMWNAANRYFVGGKKSIIYMGDIKHYNNYPAGGTNYTQASTIQQKMIMNYVKELTNPYGGTGEGALASTLYISTGHFQPITSSVITDVEVYKLALTNVVGVFGVGNTVSGAISGAFGMVSAVIGTNVYITPLVGLFIANEQITDGTSAATGDTVSVTKVYLFNGVQVGGGDCFTTLVDHGYGLQDTNLANTCSIGFLFPCESNSNYTLRRGRKISNVGMNSVGGISYFPTILEDYSYNAGYSSEGVNFQYPALPVNFFGAARFPARARFAGQKIIGETIDSFRVFLVNDYRDVNVQLGEINNVRAKGDYVYYWQNHGVGSMPILERQIVSATAGSATTLGTGGVLSRFDTFSTKFGNQHQHGLTDTIDGWIWFDMRNKDVCVMGFGGQVQEITVPTGMKSYFSEIFLERLTALYNDTYLNSQTFDISSDRPLIGTGIVGVYDPKNKMSYLTFKFRSYYKSTVEPITYDQYQVINKDFTIGFSHVINKFVGFYDKMPAIWHNHNQSVLSANDPKNLEIYYASDMKVPTPVSVGNIIKDGVKEYICTTAGNVSVYATPPSATLFTEINTTNEIYIENEEKDYSTVINGYVYNKLYGRAVNNSIDFVVNPKTEQAFAVDNQLQVGNTTNFNQFYYNTETKSAQDVNVKSWNRDYQLIDEGWNNNLPISTTGKLSGFYNLVKYVKKNWLTDPRTVVTEIKILQRVRSFFKLKF
jgi:hypothetical protein